MSENTIKVTARETIYLKFGQSIKTGVIYDAILDTRYRVKLSSNVFVSVSRSLLKEITREDIVLQDKFEEKGWKTIRHVLDSKEASSVPNFTLSFKSDKKTIWFCTLGWACAELSSYPEHYINHRYYSSLAQAFSAETK